MEDHTKLSITELNIETNSQSQYSTFARFRPGAAECNCADPFSISCPAHSKDFSESGSRAKEEGGEEAQGMLGGNIREQAEVIRQSGKQIHLKSKHSGP